MARPADSFVETIGVNTHFYYVDTNYKKFDQIVKPKLLASGIRYVRDGVHVWPSVTKDHWYYTKLRSLSNVKYNLITNPRNDLSKVKQLKNWLDGNLVSLEGINEPDAGNRQGWVERTRKWQETLYTLVKTTPELAGVKVIGPSPISKRAELGDLSQFMDFANTHSYPGGKFPTQKLGSRSLDINLAQAHIVGGSSKPVVMTETGYHTALHTDDGHKPASELAAAKYIPRLLMENFNRGIIRTFLYEFLETRTGDGKDIQKSFGLIRGDGTEKPAYLAIKNLITLLSDPGPAFSPGKLNYRFDGSNASIHSALLQKRDDSFFLALWQEVSSWDIVNRRDIDVTPVPIRIVFPANVNSVKIFHPSKSIEPIASSTNTKDVLVTVPDEVILVRIVPKGS